MTGLEPVRPFEARDFKSLASAYSATSARLGNVCPLRYSIAIIFVSGGTTRNRTGDEGFADLCLTAWLCRLMTSAPGRERLLWSGLRGSNPPPRPWQGRALPNELNPRSDRSRWCLRSELNQRHEDFQSSALPTELQRQRE